MTSFDSAVLPELPNAAITMEAIPRMPLRERLRLRRSLKLWNTVVPPGVQRVVLMNRAFIDPKGYDHDLKRYNMDRVAVAVKQMPKANAFLRSCRNLRAFILWRLSINHLLQLPAIADVFARLTTLELFHCAVGVLTHDQETQYVNVVGDLMKMPNQLKIFKYTAFTSYPTMSDRVQTLLDNNQQLEELKIYEFKAENVWNLQFRTRLKTLHIKVKTTPQLWDSLKTTSRHSLTSFTSEVYSSSQHQLVQNCFLSLRTFRCHFSDRVDGAFALVFPHLRLTTFALWSSVQDENFKYEDFLVIVNTKNLTILDLSAVIFKSAATLCDICRQCRLLQIFRFKSEAPFTNAVRDALRSLQFLEELQILNGNQMIPQNRRNGAMPKAMDASVAVVVRDCKRLRVLVVKGGAGNLTNDAIMRKAYADTSVWYFIDLDNPSYWSDYPENVKWIARYVWQPVFAGFEGDYFDWKILKEGR